MTVNPGSWVLGELAKARRALSGTKTPLWIAVGLLPRTPPAAQQHRFGSARYAAASIETNALRPAGQARPQAIVRVMTLADIGSAP
jgi:hypothetical protein